ncbi:MAG: aspartate-semialdehyde dehydrogenase [Bacteroidetes bacterium]|nr:aspartate-semialdehyde dehydrogenase [Bacteroidota bacterium]
MKIAVVGATGLVGREMLTVLAERNLGAFRLLPVASPGSSGKTLLFKDEEHSILSNEQAVQEKPEIVIFSAGAQVSLEWAPRYVDAGGTVIDNSSAWRMNNEVPLIVPEINGNILTKKDKIIANPNCSTIGVVVALAPLHRKYQIRRIVISTYQSVTGSGIRAVRQLENERAGILGEMAYPHPIDLNLFPHGGYFLPDGYTSEEIKLVNETRKILAAPSLQITGTVVRVPVMGGHSAAINVEFETPADPAEVRLLLSKSEGVVVLDDPEKNVYPMPLYARGKDEVFVGRIRKDESMPNTLNLFVVTDNLRKGAATNAIQIAQYLLVHDLLIKREE